MKMINFIEIIDISKPSKNGRRYTKDSFIIDNLDLKNIPIVRVTKSDGIINIIPISNIIGYLSEMNITHGSITIRGYIDMDHPMIKSIIPQIWGKKYAFMPFGFDRDAHGIKDNVVTNFKIAGFNLVAEPMLDSYIVFETYSEEDAKLLCGECQKSSDVEEKCDAISNDEDPQYGDITSPTIIASIDQIKESNHYKGIVPNYTSDDIESIEYYFEENKMTPCEGDMVIMHDTGDRYTCHVDMSWVCKESNHYKGIVPNYTSDDIESIEYYFEKNKMTPCEGDMVIMHDTGDRYTCHVDMSWVCNATYMMFCHNYISHSDKILVDKLFIDKDNMDKYIEQHYPPADHYLNYYYRLIPFYDWKIKNKAEYPLMYYTSFKFKTIGEGQFNILVNFDNDMQKETREFEEELLKIDMDNHKGFCVIDSRLLEEDIKDIILTKIAEKIKARVSVMEADINKKDIGSYILTDSKVKAKQEVD